MPENPRYYRLVIRNQDDDGDLLVLSSFPGDANCLLSLEPNADGQRIDWVAGTNEIGVVVWRAIDAHDSGEPDPNVRIITSLLADSNARNQMLSNRAIGRFSDDGSTWDEFHSGYVNTIRLPNALEFEFTIGDTDRREQAAELFKFLTPTFGRGSDILSGSIPHIDGRRPHNSPALSFAGLKDYGAVRMHKVAATAGANTIALELVSGYIRPYRQKLLTTVAADEVETINRIARPWAVTAIGTGRYAAGGPGQRRAWMDFPGLIIRMKRVSDGVTFDRMPVAVPTPAQASGDNDRLVVGKNMGLYVYWPSVQPVPDDGTQFDVWVFPDEISENAPLHWAGNPVDFATQAFTQEGIPYDAASAASVRSALANLWLELVFTGPAPLSEVLANHIYGPFGFMTRPNALGAQVFFRTRAAAPASVDTITITDVV